MLADFLLFIGFLALGVALLLACSDGPDQAA